MPTLFVTVPSDAAERLATGVVEGRLAPCVNRVACQSTYRWEGEPHDDEEVILLVKTTDEAVAACRDWIEAEHPHDVPCIERFDAEATLPAYGAWIDDVVSE